MDTQKVSKNPVVLGGLVLGVIVVGLTLLNRTQDGGSSVRRANDSLQADICRINPDRPECK